MENNHQIDTTKQEKRVRFVVLFTLFVIIAEVLVGLMSQSMALLADSIHMGSHVLVIGLNWVAYIVVRHLQTKKSTTYDAQKILNLSGFTSGLLLFGTGILIVTEAFERMGELDTHLSNYSYAVGVVLASLIANVICVLVMREKDEKGDYNSRAVYFHLVSDVLTKIGTLGGLVFAHYWDIMWIDAGIAIVSAVIAMNWSRNLLWETGRLLTRRAE